MRYRSLKNMKQQLITSKIDLSNAEVLTPLHAMVYSKSLRQSRRSDFHLLTAVQSMFQLMQAKHFIMTTDIPVDR